MPNTPDDPPATEPGPRATPPAKSRRGRRHDSCPPYNPGLQKLVEGKHGWAHSLDAPAKTQGFRGWHQRGYLPHCDVPGVSQFVTFRLQDGLPANRRAEWRLLLEIEDERERRARLEDYLDRGHGECWLRQRPIAELVENALRCFAGRRHGLRAWVIMPNHVHVVVDIWEVPLAELLQSWKSFTARKANKRLRRNGAFWEREYWDTRIRDEAHLRKAIRYVESNPVKARLVADAKDWVWSSARFRNDRGTLCLPPRNTNLD